MTNHIKVIVADNHPHEVTGISDLLAFIPRIEVIGQALTAQQAVLQVLDKKPDVILLDIVWFHNKEEGLNAIRQIREGAPETRILAMTAYDEVLDAARLAGADRVINKDYLNSKEALADQIQAAYDARLLPSVSQNQALFETLSNREREVLRWMCEGLQDKAIAERLCLSPTTVKKYVSNIYGKLNVSGRTEAVSLAIQRGLLSQKSEGMDNIKKKVS